MIQGVSKIFITLNLLLLSSIYSCSVNKQVIKQASKILLADSAVRQGHIGISIYEPATGKYWYQLNADKYFIPASNTKLFTLYAGMKYLGDSLVGLKYEKNSDDYTTIKGTGDPTFLHPDFKNQPVFSFLKDSIKPSYLQDDGLARFTAMGKGWTWDDYQSDYSTERSEMPIYGNLAKFFIEADSIVVSPSFFYNGNIRYTNSTLKNGVGAWFKIVRPFENNSFSTLSSSVAYSTKTKFSLQSVPFKTISKNNSSNPTPTFIQLLEDTLKIKMGNSYALHGKSFLQNKIHSQPSDSMLKPMMHRSDNFFAEQTLLMVSNEKLGYMSDADIIDNLLKTDLKDIPQKPKWVDGSGLSRYNLFTAQDFVFLLNKMRNEFSWERIKNILPTGGEGTLNGYYKPDVENIFAKTGTLSNNCALSGYLITSKGKLLIFSVLNNNYYSSAPPVRRAVERFLQEIRNKR